MQVKGKMVYILLVRLNQFMQRWMAILTPLSLLIGVVFDQIGHALIGWIPFVFAVMTFISGLNIRMRDAKVFIEHPKTILVCIAFLHILMPIWAYVLAETFFDEPLLTIGFVLAVAVPTGVTSMIWITVSKGNVPLGLAIVLIDTLLAPFVMPAIVQLVVGNAMEISTKSIIIDMIWMIVLPSLAGIAVNEITKGSFPKKYSQLLAPMSKFCLFFIVLVNSSVVAPYLKNLNSEIVKIIVVVLCVSISGYLFAAIFAKLFWQDRAIGTTFIFNAGMRNIAAGVVVATSYFPAKAVLPVVLGMLFQQVLASFASQTMRKYFH